ncbi:uncharacterized protein YneF (UPF0154 family) [Variovorax boronicumulans]|uniref:hypothetical protein n=1 Tax=Variovorax boronicumulans TaxID=436515 RepID=UPI00278759DF|nr:hypothetical protein [Variovorax boronicumulans]MDQ0069489.1 uncharacterized protein YneF (UPF0154 family) [Variovorax boronicumulans]
MTLLLPLIFMIVLIGAVLFGCYLLRAILPREHSLQPRLTDEAISNYAGHAAKNAKGILACLLVLYFTVALLIYS